jgi:hypothetical protein
MLTFSSCATGSCCAACSNTMCQFNPFWHYILLPPHSRYPQLMLSSFAVHHHYDPQQLLSCAQSIRSLEESSSLSSILLFVVFLVVISTPPVIYKQDSLHCTQLNCDVTNHRLCTAPQQPSVSLSSCLWSRRAVTRWVNRLSKPPRGSRGEKGPVAAAER